MNTVLGTLRVGLHVMVAFLLFFGLIRAGVSDDLSPIVIVLVIAFGIVYLCGTVIERRRSLRSEALARGPQVAWLVVIIALWLSLMWRSPDFMWLEFPLVFLVLTTLPRFINIIAVVALWAAAAFLPLLLFPEHWSVAAAIGPAIGTVLAVVIHYAYAALHREAIRYRIIAEELRATQAELSATEHQAGRLEERERLSREIHDTVAQGLSSIVLLARAAKKSDAPVQQLDTIEEVAATNLEEARRFVRDLASPETSLPLPQALEQVVARAQAREQALGTPLKISLNIEGFEGGEGNRPFAIPDRVIGACIRAAQEGLNNIGKHAGATQAVLSLAVFSDAVVLDIADNGSGQPVTNGYGLTGLTRRIEGLGGTVTIESTPGSGTVLAVRIPLTSKKEV